MSDVMWLLGNRGVRYWLRFVGFVGSLLTLNWTRGHLGGCGRQVDRMGGGGYKGRITVQRRIAVHVSCSLKGFGLDGDSNLVLDGRVGGGLMVDVGCLGGGSGKVVTAAV